MDPTTWHLPMANEMTTDIKLVLEFQKAMGQEPSLPEAYRKVEQMSEMQGIAEVRDFIGKLELIPHLTDSERKDHYERLQFQYHQHQIWMELMKPVLDRNNGNPQALRGVDNHHYPQIPFAATTNVILRQTVQLGREELGLPADEQSVTEMLEQMNHEVDARTLARKVRHFRDEWSKTGLYPHSPAEMESIFLTDQMNAANEVIHERLTEPIVHQALMKEENGQRAAELL